MHRRIVLSAALTRALASSGLHARSDLALHFLVCIPHSAFGRAAAAWQTS